MATVTNALVSAVSGWLEGLDPNIGVAFGSSLPHRSAAEMRRDATFALRPGSALDPDDAAGLRVTRLWTIGTRVDQGYLDNAGVEQVILLTLTGFFGKVAERGDAACDEAALRAAADIIVSRAATRDVEMSVLNTGEGHLGYLGGVPRCVEGVSPSRMAGLDMAGFMVQVEIAIHREAAI